jgi:hypothetical protein
MWDPIHVVHVVQDSVVRAPRKYHAPLTITVNHGSPWSIENPIRPASICKAAGVGPLLFAKVRVAGSEFPRLLHKRPGQSGIQGQKRAFRKVAACHIRTEISSGFAAVGPLTLNFACEGRLIRPAW